MPDKGEEAETVTLQSLEDNKDETCKRFCEPPSPPRSKQQAAAINKRVVVGVLVTVCIMILVIVGAWFIYTTVSDSHPEWLQTIPGLHHRPSSSVRDSLIMFRSSDELSYEPWVQVINDFLKDYAHVDSKQSINIRHCNYDNFPPPDSVCEVDIQTFHKCSRDFKYGYHKSSPCIFLKIHKFPNWVPQYYNKTDLPNTMPDSLKNNIKQQPPEKLQTVWVSCEGETPSDKEFIGPVSYFPQMGFPGYYFPYRNTEGYMSPLVAIHLERPQVGVVINIECKLWAKNIVHDREKGIGLASFQVMID